MFFKPLTEIFFWVMLIMTPNGQIIPVQSDGYYKNMAACEKALMEMMDKHPQLNIRAGTCLSSDRYLAENNS